MPELKENQRKCESPLQVWLFPNDMIAWNAQGFSEAPYLAPEFAVLKAVQGETIRHVINPQSLTSQRQWRGDLLDSD